MAEKIKRWINSVIAVVVVVCPASTVGRAADSPANLAALRLARAGFGRSAARRPGGRLLHAVALRRRALVRQHRLLLRRREPQGLRRQRPARRRQALQTRTSAPARSTSLLDAQGGSVRDPQVHYDGRKILFSYRKAGTDYYHLYEINTDGSGLQQLTDGDFDDYEPTYLPDGDIAFVSTRCNRWVNCWIPRSGSSTAATADGDNIRPISANTEHDNTPWVHAGWPPALHALGVRGPQPGGIPCASGR